MSRIYSTLFFAAALTPGTTNVYTVPPGHVAVLRDVGAVNISVIAGLVILGDPDNGVSFATLVIAGHAGDSSQYNGHQVFPAGSTISVELVSCQADVRGSGYLLTAP